jgi:drug/metabolite transporter (DMT)-like permease
LNLKSWLLLFLLAAMWGGSFLLIRLSVDDFGPVPLTTTRSLIAACALVPLVIIRGKFAEFMQYWPHLLVLGLISVALPFSMISISTQYTTAGFASILNALTPIFSTLIAWLWLKDALTPAAMIGIALGFLGVAVMVLDSETISASYSVLPVLAGLGATFFYGLTGNYSLRYVKGITPLVVSTGCQVFSSLLLLPVAFMQWPDAPIPATGWFYATVLGIVCTGIAFMIYFHLLKTVGVARTVIVTYLVPVFAMLWGLLFIGETITLKMLAGAGLILTGIGLTTYRPRQAQ